MSLYSEIRSCDGPFIGCPGDVDHYEAILQDVYDELPIPGVRPEIYHWTKDFDAWGATAAIGSQYQIIQTSNVETNPVFIFFGNRIGTPIKPPRHGWEGMRTWLNKNGWSHIALLGEDNYQSVENIPESMIPMTGTMFELFDAMRTVEHVDLKVFDLRKVMQPSEHEKDTNQEQQKEWCDLLLDELASNITLIRVKSEADFRSVAKEILQEAFGIAPLNPMQDVLPGLEALSNESRLLFCRGELIRKLTDRVFLKRSSCTLVLGASGAGKSSLLRAGLLQNWFQRRWQGAGKRYSAHAVLIEPRLLQLKGTEDPLQSLGRILHTSHEQQLDRVAGLLPEQLPGSAPVIAPAIGDRNADLAEAFRWWKELTDKVNGPIVLIIDQAEEIHAIARQEAQKIADREGSDELEINLSPAWQRFTSLMGILMKLPCTDEIDEKLLNECDTYLHHHPVRMILGLHRRSALDIWPINHEALPQDFEVAPLSGKGHWEEIIEGTLATYGLSIDDALLDKLVNEAYYLSDEIQDKVQKPNDARNRVATSQSSVLPQVVIALQRIMTFWRNAHLAKNNIEKEDKFIDLNTYLPFANIEGGIEALGEEAWRDWLEILATTDGSSLEGHYTRKRLEEDQEIHFGNLLSGLVDARSADQQDLTYLAGSSKRAKQHAQLIDVLRKCRLLTTTDKTYLRLPHRSILDHWSRPQLWLKQIGTRLNSKDLARRFYEQAIAPEQWTPDQLDSFIDLNSNWIGSKKDEDAQVLEYIYSGVIRSINFFSLLKELKKSRFPQYLIDSGEKFFSFFTDEYLRNYSNEDSTNALFYISSEYGYEDAAHKLLDAGANPDLEGPSSESFPLLIAAENGHYGVVKMLVDAGADPDRLSAPANLSPLLLAAQNGHTAIVNFLLSKSSNVVGTAAQNGSFPLLIAVCGNHIDIVSSLLQNGADVNQYDHQIGTSSVLEAAAAGHLEIALTLLEFGANVNQTNALNGLSPLLQAAQNGHREIVAKLIEHGADTEHVSNEWEGIFPLLQAAQNKHLDIARMLIAAGANVNQQSTVTGYTPLLKATQKGCAELCMTLLNEGASPGVVDFENGLFALLGASQSGSKQIALELIKAGADVNQVNEIDGLFPILQAAMNGHTDIVRELITAGADLNKADIHSGYFPLSLAAQNDHLDIVRLLLEFGGSPHQKNLITGEGSLQIAACQGHKVILEELVQAGADVNATNSLDGVSALMLAAQEGHACAVSFLLERGADIQHVSYTNGFALLLASHNGQDDVIDLLLEAGADVEQQTPDEGMFPLLQAAQMGHHRVVAKLLEREANPNQVNKKNGLSALIQASMSGSITSISELIHAGADANHICHEGHTPLIRACLFNNVEGVTKLIEAGAHIDYREPKDGFTAIHFAIIPDETEIPKRLLQAGASVALANNNGSFPLEMAVKNNNIELVSLLLNFGADIDQTNDKTGSTAIFAASNYGYKEIVDLLISAGADFEMTDTRAGVTPLFTATVRDHSEIVKSLLAAGADPNFVAEDGTFPLYLAARFGYEDLAAVLTGYGCDPNRIRGNDGGFPLLIAVDYNHLGIVKILLDSGANANQFSNEIGGDALTAASARGNSEIVHLLLKRGANRNLVDQELGKIPLIMAAQDGHLEIVEALLAAGANPSFADHELGNFPLVMAAQNDHQESVEALLAGGADPNQIQEQNGCFALQVASLFGHGKIVSSLIAAGANPNLIQLKSGQSSLHYALIKGHANIVEQLVEAGADVNFISKKSGGSPLHLAAEKNEVKSIRTLMDAGADIYKSSDKHLSPFLHAINQSKRDAVAEFLKMGADPNRPREEDGFFPIYYACGRDCPEIVELLLNAGADPEQTNLDGTFPLLIAAARGHDRIASLLLEYGADVHRIDVKRKFYPLITAMTQGHDETVETLRDAGAEIKVKFSTMDFLLLPIRLAVMATKFVFLKSLAALKTLRSSHINIDFDREQSPPILDCSEEPVCSNDTTGDVAFDPRLPRKKDEFPEARPPVFGHWEEADVEVISERLHYVLRINETLNLPVSEVVSAKTLPDFGETNTKLYSATFISKFLGNDYLLDLTWWDLTSYLGDTALFPLYPGAPLDGVLVDLEGNDDFNTNWTNPEASKALANLVLLTSFGGASALGPDEKLPFANQVMKQLSVARQYSKLQITQNPKSWRPWHLFYRPEGNYVQIPCITNGNISGKNLALVKIFIPLRTGIGARVDKISNVLAKDVDLLTYDYFEDEDGDTLPLRIIKRLKNVAGQRTETEPPKTHLDGGIIPRNSPCPCGSGKRYKHCCGRI